MAHPRHGPDDGLGAGRLDMAVGHDQGLSCPTGGNPLFGGLGAHALLGTQQAHLRPDGLPFPLDLPGGRQGKETFVIPQRASPA